MTTTRFDLIEINMNYTMGVVEAAKGDLWTEDGSFDVAALAAKVSIYAIVPFLLIAAFEAVVINGLAILFNGAIATVNWTLDFWQEKQPEVVEVPVPQPVVVQPLPSPASLPSSPPPIGRVTRLKNAALRWVGK